MAEIGVKLSIMLASHMEGYDYCNCIHIKYQSLIALKQLHSAADLRGK